MLRRVTDIQPQHRLDVMLLNGLEENITMTCNVIMLHNVT